ncbi:unnamed protein product, partial [Effrenium voratum]
ERGLSRQGSTKLREGSQVTLEEFYDLGWDDPTEFEEEAKKAPADDKANGATRVSQ